MKITREPVGDDHAGGYRDTYKEKSVKIRIQLTHEEVSRAVRKFLYEARVVEDDQPGPEPLIEFVGDNEVEIVFEREVDE